MARGFALLLVVALAATVRSDVVEEFTFESSNDGFKCWIAEGVSATCSFADHTSSYNSAGGIGVTVKSPPPEKKSDVVLVSGAFDLKSGETYTVTFWAWSQKLAMTTAVVVDNKGKEIASEQVATFVDWAQHAVQVSAPASGQYRLRIEGIAHGISLPLGTSAKFMYDGFVVSEGKAVAKRYEAPRVEAPPNGDPYAELPVTQEELEALESGSISLPKPVPSSGKPAKGALVLDPSGGTDSSSDKANSMQQRQPELSVTDEEEVHSSWSDSGSSTSSSGSSSGGSLIVSGSGASTTAAPARRAPLDTTGALPGTESITADYENGNNGGFEVWVDESRATAVVSEKSGHGAYEGYYGLSIKVVESGRNNWEVQVKSPPLIMDEGGEYSLTFWAKATEPSTVQVDLLNRDGYDWREGVEIAVTPNWQQFMLGPAQVPELGVFVYTINMGEWAGTTFWFDNFELAGCADCATAPAGVVSSGAAASTSALTGPATAGAGEPPLIVDVTQEDLAQAQASAETTGETASSSAGAGETVSAAAEPTPTVVPLAAPVLPAESSVLTAGNTESVVEGAGLGSASSSGAGVTTVVSLTPTSGRRLAL